MPRIIVLSLAAAAACLTLAGSLATAARPPATATAASARHVVSAYLWFEPTTGRAAKFERGNIHFVFRTDRALPLTGPNSGFARTSIRFGPFASDVSVISQRLHCYVASSFLDTDGVIGPNDSRPRIRALPGDRVRVRIGAAGALLDRRFVVQPRRFGYPRGEAIGCGADPKAGTVVFNLTDEPKVQPDRLFFQADAGPYLKDLKWIGWGTNRAAARGRFISDCASCFPKENVAATVILSHKAYCANYGASTYRYAHMVRRLPSGKKRTSFFGVGYVGCEPKP